MKWPAAMLVVASLAVSGPASGQTVSVQIRNNDFSPADVHVTPGDTVSWRLQEGEHSATSDLGKWFDSGVMRQSGRTFSFRAPHANVTIYYHCRIHGFAGDGTTWGSGMVGRIVVGAGSPAPRTASDVDVRRVPSRRWPSVESALGGLKADGRYRVELAPGRYRPTDVTPARLGFRGAPAERFELTIRGTGARPADVVFDGGDTGIGISVDGMHIENLSFSRQAFAAVFVRDAQRWSVDDVTVTRAGRYGIWVDGAVRGRVRRTSVDGARVAGIASSSCDTCDLLVDSVTVTRSLQGIAVLGGSGFVVRGSTFRNNGTAVSLKGTPATPQSGADVLLNTFRDNMNRGIAAPQPSQSQDFPVGAGVWLDGGALNNVERNDFDGHVFGVVATSGASASRVVNNTIAHSAQADLAWDGLGANVCFAGNAGPELTTMPPEAQTLYGCGLPATAGIPDPAVTALVLAWGLGIG